MVPTRLESPLDVIQRAELSTKTRRKKRLTPLHFTLLHFTPHGIYERFTEFALRFTEFIMDAMDNDL